MSETSILSRGLFLLNQSPFKQAQPSQLDASQPQTFNVEEAITLARDQDSVFADVGVFLKKRNYITDEYYHRLSTRCLQQDANLISGTLHDEMIKDPESAHLKIKLLSEHALSRVTKDEKLMGLEGLNVLDSHITELEVIMEEINTQLKQNARTIDNTLSKAEDGSFYEDIDILRALISSNSALAERLIEVSKELESKHKTLNSQFLLVFSLGYFEDLNLALPVMEQTTQYDRDTEEIMSYIVSTAVQKNIMLPPPNPEAPKVQWAKDCLDAILLTSNKQGGPISNGSIKSDTETDTETDTSKDQEISKLKTAFEDLQFAHKYLTRQFEEERNMNSTVMKTHIKKKLHVEDQLAHTKTLLEKSNQRSILVEHEKNLLDGKLDENIKELYDLKRQIANLKIESLGFIHPNHSPNGSDKENRSSGIPENLMSPTSPITGVELQLDGNYQNPKTPLTQKNVNNYKFQSPSSSKFNSSISVLRSEFKKLVNEMHANFESELTKERNERKRLENLLKRFEERDDEMDL